MAIQFSTPRVSTEWASNHETHPAVAMAIHAISDATRTPEAIWEAPTSTEWDHVTMAVENYTANGVFEAEDDGRYPWGGECIVINTPATYTVTSAEGENPRSGLSLRDAADEILSSDSREWKIERTEDGMWVLWSRQQVANRGWETTITRSWADTQAEAEAEIFAEVIQKSGQWRGHDIAVTDAEYDKAWAEAEAEANA